jgi:hypothetical protein
MTSLTKFQPAPPSRKVTTIREAIGARAGEALASRQALDTLTSDSTMSYLLLSIHPSSI